MRNPEGTELGKKIIKERIQMINKTGIEEKRMKKMEEEIGSTEESI